MSKEYTWEEGSIKFTFRSATEEAKKQVLDLGSDFDYFRGYKNKFIFNHLIRFENTQTGDLTESNFWTYIINLREDIADKLATYIRFPDKLEEHNRLDQWKDKYKNIMTTIEVR